MGVELLSSAPKKQFKTCRELFDYCVPEYVAMGMPLGEFWNDDVNLVSVYQKAFLIKQSNENQRLWLQGRYVYEAIADLVPVLHAFAGKNAKPIPYSEEPYPLTVEEAKAQEERKKIREYYKMLDKMKMYEKRASEGENKCPTIQ